MAFTGKATYSGEGDLAELVDDVADVVSIVSPHETPLLDLLGDPTRPAQSTIHEWIEDELLPNTDSVNQTSFSPNPTDATSITVANGNRFRVGDQVRPVGIREIMFVTAVAGNTLTVVRRYGNTTGGALANGMKLIILGNAAIEGDDRPTTRFGSRVRKRNYTQIFTASVEVSGSLSAARAHGVPDEIDYQKQERIRELLRDLENCVVNGVAPTTTQQGSSSVRRTMNGLIPAIATNQFSPGVGPIPAGGGGGLNELSEDIVNAALRAVWEQSSGRIDTILVGGAQKRRFNQFVASGRRYAAMENKMASLVNIYESDFGVCRLVLSRWLPQDTMVFLDASRVQVLPLRGRSFHYKPLAAAGDSEVGQVIGEYTMELRNENAHAVLRGLAL